MDNQVRKALEESIEHWNRLLKAKTPNDVCEEGFGELDCPLCKLFFNQREYCQGCPIYEKTGDRFCKNTPYKQAEEDLNEFSSKGELKKFPLTSVRAMRNFLVELLEDTKKEGCLKK